MAVKERNPSTRIRGLTSVRSFSNPYKLKIDINQSQVIVFAIIKSVKSGDGHASNMAESRRASPRLTVVVDEILVVHSAWRAV